MTARRLPARSNLTIMSNSGIMPSWVGIIMVAMMISNMPFLPLKRSFAKAKPASEAKKRRRR